MDVDVSLAQPVAEDTEYEDILDACAPTVDGVRILDVARVGVSPGPCSALDFSDGEDLNAAVQPIMTAHGTGPSRPKFMALWAAAEATGGTDAQKLMRWKRMSLQAAVEYLFSSEYHGGMYYIPDTCVFLPSALPPVLPVHPSSDTSPNDSVQGTQPEAEAGGTMELQVT